MPERDRDRSVDRLLRDVMSTRGTQATPACLDAESIAAWTAGSLPSAEAARAERHVADCSRCQAVVATLVRTTPDEPAARPAWSRWRLPWLVPIATAVTALALWFALPGRGPSPFAPEPAVETMARQAPPEPQAEEPRAAESVAQAPQRPDTEKPVGRLADESARRNANEEARAGVAPAERDASPDALGKNVAGVRQEAEAPAPAQAREFALRSPAAVAPTIEILASNGTARWRISAGRRVEWSSSDGSAWESATVVPADDLTAGSAPSSSTCWLVGRRGAVYLTTDGERFARLAFPESVDLVQVAAVDDQAATVTAADGRTWSTADQGRTWSPK